MFAPQVPSGSGSQEREKPKTQRGDTHNGGKAREHLSTLSVAKPPAATRIEADDDQQHADEQPQEAADAANIHVSQPNPPSFCCTAQRSNRRKDAKLIRFGCDEPGRGAP
jgi:hypothetical protein